MVYNHQTIKKAWRQIMDAFVVVEYDFDRNVVDKFLEKVYTRILELTSERKIIINLYNALLEIKWKSKINSKNYYIATEIINYLKQNKIIVVKK